MTCGNYNGIVYACSDRSLRNPEFCIRNAAIFTEECLLPVAISKQAIVKHRIILHV